MRDANQFLTFDMMVRNVSGFTLRISQIELSVYDSAHQLVLRKSINTDAFAPSIAVIGKQILAPGETLDVFNPFPEFESSVPLTDLQYSFCLLRESDEQRRDKIGIDCPMIVTSGNSSLSAPAHMKTKLHSFCHYVERCSSGKDTISMRIINAFR